MAADRPFWIVVCDLKPATDPDALRALRPAERPHRHFTLQSAIDEAARLTRECRSQTFFVFEAVAEVKPPPDVVITRLRDFHDDFVRVSPF